MFQLLIICCTMITTRNYCSNVFFTWLFPILFKGWKDPNYIKEFEVHVSEEDKAEILVARLEKAWEKSAGSKNPSLFKTLANVFGVKYMLLGLTAFIEECVIRVGQPVLLGYLLQYFKGYFSTLDGWLLASGVIFMSLWYALQHPPFFFAMQHNGMNIRVAVSGLIFKKALKLPAFKESVQGKLLNIMASDVNRLDLSKDFMHYIWIAPIQFLIVTAILWTHFSWTSLVGMSLLVVFIPLQTQVGRWFGKFRGQVSLKTDDRLKTVAEILSGISTIKIHAWESYFIGKIKDKRKEESKILMKLALLRSINQSLYYVTCKIVLFAMLLIYVTIVDELTPEKVFVAMSLFNNVRMTLTLFLPFGISQFAEIAIALKRIQEFLLEAETVQVKSQIPSEAIQVKCINLCTRWGQNEKYILENINVSLEKGDFLGVIGPLGSGKTSLLQAILQELPLQTGKLEVNGSIGYVPQNPWISHGTLRDNILFGKEYDAEFYNEVVTDCCLTEDFKQFPQGDETFVQDGKTLSGGQRARIALARAIYSNASILLLDDVLSAVDVRVGKQLLQRAINSRISDKIIIFTTNQIHHLKEVKTTHVVQLGSFSIPEFVGSWDNFKDKDEQVRTSSDATIDDIVPENLLTQEQLKGPTLEENLSGSKVPLSLYLSFFRSGGGFLVILFLIFCNIAAQGFFTGSDYWLKSWSNDMVKENNNNNTSQNFNGKGIWGEIENNRNYQIYFYSLLTGGLLLFSFLRTTIFFTICINASKTLHDKMSFSLLSTRLLFFQQNPEGRIINRFSKDMSTLDDTLPVVLFDTVEVALQVLGVLVIVSIVNYILVFPALLVCIGFYFIRLLYLQNAQILKRKEGIARSKILSHVTSSMSGLVTLRAFRAQDQILTEFYHLLDSHSSTWYLFLSSARWLGVNVDWVSLLYIGTVVGVVMVSDPTEGDAGLAITSAMSLMGILQWGVKQSSESAAQMVSVERVVEYGQLEGEEDNAIIVESDDKFRKLEGGIILKQLRYTHYPLGPEVLKGLNLKIEPGEKVSVAGRTGAGKSSLIAALLRVQEPCGGSIEIGGVDARTIPLKRLRKGIAVVPQTPWLFKGTLRQNLDPLSCSVMKEGEIQEMLNELQLQSFGLDSIIESNGSNLSSGQQQLLCLGRAMLTKASIVCLDEATSNVDVQTEAVSQRAISHYFKDATIISVAHRLKTLLHSDKVLVLGNGEILEYDDRAKLEADPTSQLSQMLSQISQK